MSLRLTSEGQIYFERTQQALKDIAEAASLITQGSDRPQ